MSTYIEPSGMDLKLERVAARVQAKQLAAEMGVSRSRITHLESQAVVTSEAAERYRAALDTCLLRRTSEAA